MGIQIVWVVVLIAAMGAMIYREIDGPTVRSVVAEQMELTKRLDEALASLAATETARDRLSVELGVCEMRCESR